MEHGPGRLFRHRANTTWTSALSGDLAGAYGGHLNTLQLKDGNGTVLVLERSGTGIYTSGTYYEYLLSVVEGSLNNFLHDTTFPYNQDVRRLHACRRVRRGRSRGHATGRSPAREWHPRRRRSRRDDDPVAAGRVGELYATPRQEYIDALNSDGEWIVYDAGTNTAKVTSIEAFVTHLKPASKSVPAFDNLNRTQPENNLFGNDASDALHFDGTVAAPVTEECRQLLGIW